MACCAKLRWGSAVLLGLCFASWIIALGGLGAINWLVCSDAEKTVDDITTNFAANFNSSAYPAGAVPDPFSKLSVPPPGTDIALCSRSYRWEWFTLFFQFAIMASALVVTAMPTRLLRARVPLANMVSIATVLVMVAVNENLTVVWWFWDTHKMFTEWHGVLQKLYYSAAALVAGWILVIIFNLVWIGFSLDCCADDDAPAEAAAAPANAPITGDLESAPRK